MEDSETPGNSEVENADTPRKEASEVVLTTSTDAALPAEPALSWRPADYYATPPGSGSRVPRWVPLSCGVASIVFLVFLFLLGGIMLSGGLDKLVALAFGEIQSEAEKLYAPEVPADDRAAFNSGLRSLRDRLADHRVALGEVLPVLQDLQSATKDGRLTAEEVERLTKAISAVGTAVRPGAKPDEPPTVDL